MPFYEKCQGPCGKSMRLLTWPRESGDVIHHGRGLCRGCHSTALTRTRREGVAAAPRAAPPHRCTACRRRFGPGGSATAHGGHGRCVACYTAAARGRLKPPQHCKDCGAALQHPRRQPGAPDWRYGKEGRSLPCYDARPRRTQRPAAHIVEDFEFLVDVLDFQRASNKIGYTAAMRQRVADRLGMKRSTLDKVLYRHLRRTAIGAESAPDAMLDRPASDERKPAA